MVRSIFPIRLRLCGVLRGGVDPTLLFPLVGFQAGAEGSLLLELLSAPCAFARKFFLRELRVLRAERYDLLAPWSYPEA